MAASDRGKPKRPGSPRGSRGAGRREPVGIERAERTPGAPPRRPAAPSRAAAAVRPDIPDDLEVDLPRSVVRDLRRATRSREDAEEAGRCLTVAAEHLAEREGAEALPFLHWAKDLAPRSPAVRESLGIAHYLAEEYASALTELQTYRRLSGAADQNHLVADCHRALGRGREQIPQLVEEMDDPSVAPERRIEGLIVWASALADSGDVGAGRAVLRDAPVDADDPDEATLRLWYVAGDLAEQAGDTEDARRWFRRITEVTDEFFDADDRLRALGT